ncbi:MAG: UDP-glucose 4-epimerase [Sulfurimonas sp.]|jgi:UDP-glucose 4-epimerase
MTLVTGGAGYVGSHILITLHEAKYNFVVYDNLCNSSQEPLKRIEKIIGKNIKFEQGDLRDKIALQNMFKKYEITSVIHCGGLKDAGESVSKALEYFTNNLKGTLVLLEVMKEYACKKIIFSSSAAVYGTPIASPIKENFEVSPITPYARTKLFIEEMLRDIYTSDNQFKIIILRYFNPVGAHKSGTIGECPSTIPSNLMPLISQTAIGKREFLNVFGADYNTQDGTCIRDYIHVVDLSLAHVKALQIISNIKEVLTINLGTGKGYSVLEMIKAYEKASGLKIPYKIAERRVGDVAECFADTKFAKEILNWETTKTIDDMCSDTWRWQFNNPNGYEKS